MKPSNSIRIIVATLLVIGTAGVAGYMIIERWPFLDALYMTVITLTTVGYGEVRPLDTAGRIFTIFLIVVGVGTILYMLTSIVQYAVEGQLTGAVGRRRMKRKIENLRDHFVLCGYGRVGQQIANELKREGIPMVIIDIEPSSVARAEADGLPTVEGNAASDEVLSAAGIERARGLIAATAQDPDNVYVTLSARSIRPDLFIVARSNWPDSESKLVRAGASRVISPYSLSGRRMAMLAVRPVAVDFIDTVMHGKDQDWMIEEVNVTADCALDGKPVQQLVDKHLPGASILAIVRKSGEIEARPLPEAIVREGDLLIVLGPRSQLSNIDRACQL